MNDLADCLALVQRQREALQNADRELAAARAALREIFFMRPIGDVNEVRKPRAIIEAMENCARAALAATGGE